MNKLTSSHKIFLREYSSPAWNLCSYCLLRKQVSFDALEAAVNEVVRKNDALRMTVKNGDEAYFVEYTPRRFERVEFSDEASFLAWAHERANEPVTNCPGMWTAFLIKINGRIGIFNIGHHIMCDALNVANLYQKIVEELNGGSDESESYAVYLDANEKYLQSRQFDKDRQYWESILSERTPLAFDGRPIGECENITIPLPPMNTVCADLGLSEATVMYAATGLLLMRLQNLDSVAVGIPVLGRTTQHEMGALGLFMRDVPMVLGGGEKSFLDFAQEVENNVIDLFRHRRYDLPQKPLFDVSVDYSEYPKTEDYSAAVIYNNYVSTAMEFHFLQREQLELTIRAQKGLFRNLHSVANAFARLLQEIRSNPKQSIWTLAIADLPSAGSMAEIPDVGLYSLVEKQLTGRIIDGKQEHSLAELRRDAEKIDAAVHGEKRTIGVLCDRSYAELAAIYGIVRGGNAYLPISPDYPAARIQLLLKQSGCKTVLSQRKYRHIVPDALVIEEILEGDLPNAVPAISALPDDPLYVIFTSGSTGTPKGAMVSNRSAINRIRWMCEKYFSSETVVMLKTPFTFDVSVWEIFGFALGGFTLYILPPEDHYRQDRVIEHIRRGRVTDLHFVPTVCSHFLDALKKDGNPLPSLQNIFLSGEALSASLANRAPATVHNLYGPTECAVDVTYYDCAKVESDPVPIGRPIDNCQMYVLDQRLQPLPIGIVGQIFIGGVPVGLGYVNDAAKTKHSFVPDPFSNGQLYQTGDLGYWREDGELVFVGRADNQVKIHGQRIELGEIEAALNAFVPASVVVFEEDRLLAFYTGDEHTGLREQLSRILPRHMIPNRFIHVTKMPMTASGKIDRKALLMMPRQDSSLPIAPTTHEEELLLNAVKEALHLTTISITDNFYELGGDSLSSLFVITSLQDLGYDLSVTDFLKSETLEVAAEKMNRLTDVGEPLSVESTAVSPIVKADQYEKLFGSSSEFEDVLQRYSPDDVYDLTPSQLGMYHNWEQYQLYYTVEFGEKPDIQRLEKAVSLLVQRHPILRSKFVELSNGSVKQLILKDWQHSSNSDNLFRVKPNGLNLTVETHHIILDGWSLSILARDLIDYYHASEASISPTNSFGRYSQWLHTQSTDLSYWKELLSGCGVSSDLPHISNFTRQGHEIAEHLVSSEGIASFAKEHRVSINTVLETAFAMLLRGTSPVLFGKVISGRNAPIPGIDEIVGPFVNTVPVYVKSNDDILSQIHEQSIMTNKFGFIPLAELYAHTDLRRINILFVFDNFPYASTIPLINYKEENEFDLTVSIREADSGYLIRASYAPEKYQRSVIEETLRNFDLSLRQLLSGVDMPGSLQMQVSANYEAPIGEIESTICELFERVIGVTTVGRHDNYYDLGGTSLNMMELLCETPLDALSPSEFMQNPTPAGLAKVVINRSASSLPVPLYTPEDATAAYVLFPYGGGDAAAYTALVAEFRKREASVALLFVPWGCDYNVVADNLQSYPLPIYFYSHCAGSVIAMKLLDRVNGVKKYIAGASIPPEEMHNIWPSVANEMLISVLYDAGMPKLPQSQEDAMLRQFRENTGEYFCYFSDKNQKTPTDVTLIFSREDIFTNSHLRAAELWDRYIERVDKIYYIDSTTHYFQSTQASDLAEILLKEVYSCYKS